MRETEPAGAGPPPVAGLIVSIFLAALPFGTPIWPILGLAIFLFAPRIEPRALTLPVRGMLLLFPLFLLHVADWKGVAELGLCVLSLLLFATLKHPRLFDWCRLLTVFFAAVSLVVVPLRIVFGELPLFDQLFYIVTESGPRYRFVFPEPNHMVATMLFLALLTQSLTRRRPVEHQWLVGVGLLAAVVGSASPFGYGGLLLYAGQYSITLKRGSITLVAMGAGLLAVLIAVDPDLSARFGNLASGQDGSTNLRIFGGLAIALATIYDEGVRNWGFGLGGGSIALSANPYTTLFAFNEGSQLPSFLASMILETGLYGSALVGGLVASIITRAAVSFTLLIASGFLLLNLLSGSYFYDTVSWAEMGLILNWAWRAGVERRVAASSPIPIGGLAHA